ncbi:unnamed protein product [Prunus armeniaca]|uniref:Uncharacterized protein n=1 Tax=Prunus armeniaca TaxID=36596 RepID=A0A6J5XFE4_PRUAR|nr:unnamed protein product [Prunus armeniaca]CAB4312560.1 unnamed protein product [Prunus armeniaca]
MSESEVLWMLAGGVSLWVDGRSFPNPLWMEEFVMQTHGAQPKWKWILSPTALAALQERHHPASHPFGTTGGEGERMR